MQAARGASLTDADTVGGRRDRSTGRGRRWLLLLAVAGSLYAVDQASKAVAVARLDGEPDVRVVGDLLVLHLTRNPGAAFSTGTEYTVVLSVVAVLAVGVILLLMRRVADTTWTLALGLLLAGVGGNLTDRIARDPGLLRGHVVDFLMLPHWPVFNVADICINLAAATILVQAFRGIRLDGTRVAERVRRAGDGSPDSGPDSPSGRTPDDASSGETALDRDDHG